MYLYKYLSGNVPTKTKMKNTGYYTKSEKGKLESKWLLACLPDTDKEIFHASLLKTVFFFTNQAVQCQFGSCIVLYGVLSTSCFSGNSPWLSLKWVCRRFWIKSLVVNIIQFHSISVSLCFLFQSLDVRASENLWICS